MLSENQEFKRAKRLPRARGIRALRGSAGAPAGEERSAKRARRCRGSAHGGVSHPSGRLQNCLWRSDAGHGVATIDLPDGGRVDVVTRACVDTPCALRPRQLVAEGVQAPRPFQPSFHAGAEGPIDGRAQRHAQAVFGAPSDKAGECERFSQA
jgi:hypothetical protein